MSAVKVAPETSWIGRSVLEVGQLTVKPPSPTRVHAHVEESLNGSTLHLIAQDDCGKRALAGTHPIDAGSECQVRPVRALVVGDPDDIATLSPEIGTARLKCSAGSHDGSCLGSVHME